MDFKRGHIIGGLKSVVWGGGKHSNLPEKWGQAFKTDKKSHFAKKVWGSQKHTHTFERKKEDKETLNKSKNKHNNKKTK